MQVQVNGQSLEFPQDTLTIAGLLQELGYNNHFIAVAVNSDCVPRQAYETHFIHAKDRIEILAPMAGG